LTYSFQSSTSYNASGIFRSKLPGIKRKKAWNG
jgi:hypothetical protein